MIPADRLRRNFAATQLVGSAILATLLVLPVAKGTFYLAQAMGFARLAETRTSVLIVVAICWLVLSIPGTQGRWPGIARTLADPTRSTGDKIRATFTNWFSLLMIVAMLVWIASASFNGGPILP